MLLYAENQYFISLLNITAGIWFEIDSSIYSKIIWFLTNDNSNMTNIVIMRATVYL